MLRPLRPPLIMPAERPPPWRIRPPFRNIPPAMLDIFRKASKTWAVKIFFALLALSFVSWGVGDFVRGGAGRGPAIEVGKTAISAGEVMAEFKREVERLQPLFGGKLTPEDARKLGLLDRTIESLVTRTLVDEAGRSLGLSANDEQILRQVTSNAAFRNELGQFDRDLFRRTLARAGYSEDGFLKVERANVIRQQMAEGLSSGVVAPSVLVDPLLHHREERRTAELIQVNDDQMPMPPAPEAAIVEQYYKDNTAHFMAAEFRKLTVLLLRSADVADEVLVTPEMVAEAYQQRQDEFNTPERRQVSQLVLDDKAAAMVARGMDLNAIAKALDTQVLDIGVVEKGDLPEELAEPVFAQAANTIKPPIKTALGWHVIRIAGVQAGRTRALPEVKGQIEQDLRREKSLDVLSQFATKVEDALGGGATLEEAAKTFNLRTLAIAAVDAQGRGPNGKLVADLPKSDQFLDVAFHTEQGTESQLTEIDGNGYFLLRVDQVTQPQPKPLAEVRAEVVAALQGEKRHAAARERAEKIAEQMKTGEPATKIAQSFGAKTQVTEPFTREGGAEAAGLAPTVVAEMFRVPVGGVGIGSTQNGHVVARLARVVPFDPTRSQTVAEAARRKVSQAVSGDVVDQYVAALNAAIGVKVDRSQLNREE